MAGTNAILAESVSWGRNLALPLLCYQLQVTAEAFLCLLAIGPPMPATQAGPVDRELTFRDVFTAAASFLSSVSALIRVRWPHQPLALPVAAA